MNLIDLWVTEVLSEPVEKYGKWWVKVKATAYGHESESDLMFTTKEEALTVKPGHKFVG